MTKSNAGAPFLARPPPLDTPARKAFLLAPGRFVSPGRTGRTTTQGYAHEDMSDESPIVVVYRKCFIVSIGMDRHFSVDKTWLIGTSS